LAPALLLIRLVIQITDVFFLRPIFNCFVQLNIQVENASDIHVRVVAALHTQRFAIDEVCQNFYLLIHPNLTLLLHCGKPVSVCVIPFSHGLILTIISTFITLAAVQLLLCFFVPFCYIDLERNTLSSRLALTFTFWLPSYLARSLGLPFWIWNKPDAMPGFSGQTLNRDSEII